MVACMRGARRTSCPGSRGLQTCRIVVETPRAPCTPGTDIELITSSCILDAERGVNDDNADDIPGAAAETSYKQQSAASEQR